MKISVKIERKGKSSYRAHCPNLPGCFAVGNSRAESLNKIDTAIHAYLASMNQPTPKSIRKVVREVQSNKRIPFSSQTRPNGPRSIQVG